MTPVEMKVLSLIDGRLTLGGVSQHLQIDLTEVAAIVRGLELAGLLEPRSAGQDTSILIIEDDPETARSIHHVLGPEGEGCRVQAVRDAVSAQILLRRNRFELVLLSVDRPGQESLIQAVRRQLNGSVQIIGITALAEEDQIRRLDALGIDGILSRPVCEADLRDILNHLREARGADQTSK